jgi:hypothetical protein
VGQQPCLGFPRGERQADATLHDWFPARLQRRDPPEQPPDGPDDGAITAAATFARSLASPIAAPWSTLIARLRSARSEEPTTSAPASRMSRQRHHARRRWWTSGHATKAVRIRPAPTSARATRHSIGGVGSGTWIRARVPKQSWRGAWVSVSLLPLHEPNRGGGGLDSAGGAADTTVARRKGIVVIAFRCIPEDVRPRIFTALFTPRTPKSGGG